MRISYLAAAVVVVAMIALATFLAEPYNRAGALGSGGLRLQGSALGIAIGVEREDAHATLIAHGLSVGQPQAANHCLGRDYGAEDETLELWDDRSWRRGTVCLGLRNGKVVSIAWSYGAWPL